MSCAQGFHSTCKSKLFSEPCTCSTCNASATGAKAPAPVDSDLGQVEVTQSRTVFTIAPTEDPVEVKQSARQSIRRPKRDGALKDQQSTGRKRAAKLYPLDREALCEWAMTPNVEASMAPMAGCGMRENAPVGKQQARHHGPDYNTLNNDQGNVHRICHSCHNTYHAINDPLKGEAYLKQYGIHAGGANFEGSKVDQRKINN